MKFKCKSKHICWLLYGALGLIILYYNAYPYYGDPPYSYLHLTPNIYVLVAMFIGMGLTTLLASIVPYFYSYLRIVELMKAHGFTVLSSRPILVFFLVIALPGLMVLTIDSFTAFVLIPAGNIAAFFYAYQLIVLMESALSFLAPILYLLLVVNRGMGLRIPRQEYLVYWVLVIMLVDVIAVSIAQIVINYPIESFLSPLYQTVYLRGWHVETARILLERIIREGESITRYTLVPTWGFVISYLVVKPMLLDYFTRKRVLKYI